MPEVVIGVPVKPFPAAKRRLAEVLDDAGRAALGRALAVRTVDVVAAAGARPLVLSADDEVTAWAHSLGVEVLLDEGSSLDQAAAAAVAHVRAAGLTWGILHADLPTLTASELAPAVEVLASRRPVIAPSSDGGTSLLGGSFDRFPFAYGPGSFHRHLAALAAHDPLIVVERGLALDLDTPTDLAAASAVADGAWLRL